MKFESPEKPEHIHHKKTIRYTLNQLHYRITSCGDNNFDSSQYKHPF